MKISCSCGGLAVWHLMDSSDSIYHCDSCVPRNGCSCNFDMDGNNILDDDVRLFPCADYLWSEFGFDNDDPLNDSDLFDIHFNDS